MLDSKKKYSIDNIFDIIEEHIIPTILLISELIVILLLLKSWIN